MKVIFVFLCCALMVQINVEAQKIKPKKVVKMMRKVADWQMDHFRDTYSGREKPHHIADWTNGALYVGMVKLAKTVDEQKYWDWLIAIGEKQNWQLHQRTYMADDHVVGQMYLELFRKFNQPEMMLGTKQRFDFIMDHPSKQPITLDNYKHLERWTWCDALFMGPPVWAKLANITGNKEYSTWMLSEYEVTKQHLFDTEENLFYRDNSFIGKKDHGRKIFWSRGNGWVFGGLALLLDEYEPGTKEHSYFKALYLSMANKLIKIQTSEGHWSMSLLSQKEYPTPETSGTSFFTFGLSWGVNHGLLDREKFEPVIVKAWQALTSHITKEGMLGYVQPIGAGPDKAFPDQTEVYGTGAFLAAGAEVYTMFGGR